MKLRQFLTIIFIALLWNGAYSQKNILTLDDAVLYYMKGLMPERPDGLRWIPKSDHYSTLNDDSSIMTIHSLSKSMDVDIAAADLQKGMTSFPRITWMDANHFYFFKDHKIFTYDLAQKTLSETLSYSDKAQNTTYSDKGQKLAFTIDNNLYIADGKTPLIAVTNEKDSNIVSGQAIARSEFGITNGIFWSPKGDLLAFYRKDESNVTTYPLVDITTTPASLNNIKYPMNGQGSEIPSALVYNPLTGKTIQLKTKQDDHYITNLGWDANQKYIYLAEINRDQNHMWLNKYKVKTGAFVKTLFEEENPKWVEPENPVYFVPKTKNKCYWLSERDGFMNIYEVNTRNGKTKQLTHNKWVTKGIVGYSSKTNDLIFSGTGPNPMNTHTFAVNLKTGKQRQLTKEDGSHRVSLFGASNEWLSDEYSSTKVDRKIGYINIAQPKFQQIYEAPNPLKDVVIGTTEIKVIKSYDGSDLYTRIIKPSNFNPKKKYPVLVYVYGGPHAQLVTNRWNAGAPLWMQWMAEQGYIIYTLDGHGSGNRGFKFESEVFRHLGTHEMEDQLIGVDWLKRQTYVDPNRIAVHGWSFGGFMTTSLMLRHPGVYTTGVAGGPVIDWKWYEIMYGERYMDTEATNPDGFAEASLLNHVKNLKGHLLTIHGMVDDVVVPQHDYAFIKKCVDEGVQADFFPYPMHPHNVRGKDRIHLMTKVLNYIIEHNK